MGDGCQAQARLIGHRERGRGTKSRLRGTYTWSGAGSLRPDRISGLGPPLGPSPDAIGPSKEWDAARSTTDDTVNPKTGGENVRTGDEVSRGPGSSSSGKRPGHAAYVSLKTCRHRRLRVADGLPGSRRCCRRGQSASPASRSPPDSHSRYRPRRTDFPREDLTEVYERYIL